MSGQKCLQTLFATNHPLGWFIDTIRMPSGWRENLKKQKIGIEPEKNNCDFGKDERLCFFFLGCYFGVLFLGRLAFFHSANLENEFEAYEINLPLKY